MKTGDIRSDSYYNSSGFPGCYSVTIPSYQIFPYDLIQTSHRVLYLIPMSNYRTITSFLKSSFMALARELPQFLIERRKENYDFFHSILVLHVLELSI